MTKERISFKDGEAGLHFRVAPETHEKLRKLSYEQKKPIAQICREAIEGMLKKNNKK